MKRYCSSQATQIFISVRDSEWDNYTNLCRYTRLFCTYFQACNPYCPHTTRCISYFKNNFPSERSSLEQTVCNDLKSAVQDPSRALKSQRGEEMPDVLWNLDVHKSAIILCPESDKSIHTLTLFFSSINFNMILLSIPKFPISFHHNPIQLVRLFMNFKFNSKLWGVHELQFGNHYVRGTLVKCHFLHLF